MSKTTVSLVLAGLALGVAIVACGSNQNDGFGGGDNPGGDNSDGGGLVLTGEKNLASLEVVPATAAIEILNGAIVTQAFKVVGHFDDNSTSDITSGVTWNATSPWIGRMDGSGLYTPTGAAGGNVQVNASYKGKKGNAQLTVKLHLTENNGSVPGNVQAALKAATNPDPSIVWAYPYDGTVFPRGLGAPPLEWNGGGAGDFYYVHVTSPTFELESFTTAPPPARYAFAAPTWTKFVDSTSGQSDLAVSRWDGANATVVAKHKWTIAPASMRGTIYYWANNVGRVMRIKPGAGAPDDFSAGTFGSLPASSCTMTCHTVSADGSTLVSGGDTLGGSYNLLTNQPMHDTGGTAGSAQKRAWAMPAVSPNGKYMVQNASPLPGPPGAADGLWDTASGGKVSPSGLDGVHLGMPAFSPDGTKLAYVGVDATPGSLRVFDFNMTGPTASNDRELVPQGAGATIAWPSLTPDAKWIIYHRGNYDTRLSSADLFLASSTTPNQEVRLAALDGDTYPFAAGARDKGWNFEPTFAPVPSGGFFWVVFTSRRTYGNELLGTKDQVKQLWVAAIDQNVVQGQDPSHPPFRLPGQAIDSLNMRGYWALDPCKGDGQGCQSGTECCGGFCDGSGPDGGLVCKSATTECSQDGDRCNQTSDCCNAGNGVTCINHVCAEAPPR